MNNLNELFLQLNEDFMKAVLSDPAFKKLQASGKSLAFLKSPESFRIEGNRAIKTGLVYTYAQDKGVRQPVPVRALYDWLEFKKYGLDYKDDKERLRLAWALHFKIKKLGTFKFKRPTNIYSTATDAAIKQFEKRINDYGRNIIDSQLFR